MKESSRVDSKVLWMGACLGLVTRVAAGNVSAHSAAGGGHAYGPCPVTADLSNVIDVAAMPNEMELRPKP
jgi:hypothetical protein